MFWQFPVRFLSDLIYKTKTLKFNVPLSKGKYQQTIALSHRLSGNITNGWCNGYINAPFARTNMFWFVTYSKHTATVHPSERYHGVFLMKCAFSPSYNCPKKPIKLQQKLQREWSEEIHTSSVFCLEQFPSCNLISFVKLILDEEKKKTLFW